MSDEGGRDMLYVSAVFLFLFLPLTLGVYTLVHGQHRRYVLLAAGVLFYVFANIKTPLAILILAAVASLTYIAGRFLVRRCRRVVFTLLLLIYAGAFFELRIIYEASSGVFYFPLGAAIYLLMSISYLLDIRRGDSAPGGIVDSFLYLTFFPVMVAGPVVKYKDFRKYLSDISFNVNNFALGIKLFVTGFIEVVAVSAVMTETYKSIIGRGGQSVNAAFGIFAMLLASFAAFFAIAGWSDMGAGISRMFGINLPRDTSLTLVAFTPAGYFGSIMIGLRDWLDDYIVAPLSPLCKNKRRVSLLGAVLPLLALALFIKTTIPALIIALVAAAVAFIFRQSRADNMLVEKKYMRPLGWVVTTVLAALFWTAVAAPDMQSFFSFFRSLSFSMGDFKVYFINIALSGGVFAAVFAAALLVLAPLSYYGRAIMLRLPKKTMPMIDAALMLILLGTFVFTILFFMPQYPFYAARAFEYLVF